MKTDRIFVVGSGRCGTTWVSDWLSSNSVCCQGDETHLFVTMKELFGMPLVWLHRDEEYLVEQIRFFADRIYAHRMPKDDASKNVIIDKTPLHFRQMDLIKRVYPQALFVYLFRDGRNVAYSIKHSSWGRNWNLDHICHYWVESVIPVLDHSRDDTIFMRYENLVDNPFSSKLITSFLGLEHHGDIVPWISPVNTMNSKEKRDQWKLFDNEEQKTLTIMNDHLKKLGYI